MVPMPRFYNGEYFRGGIAMANTPAEDGGESREVAGIGWTSPWTSSMFCQ